MKTQATPKLPRWVAHKDQGVRPWAVSPPHPSGDGSYYAPIADNLSKEDAHLLAASSELFATLVELVRRIERDNLHTTAGIKLDAARAAIARATA